jgi:hypothetical protein
MRLLIGLAILVLTQFASFAEIARDSVGRPIMMFVVFTGFDRVANPETKRPEYVFYIRFPELDIPAQPLLLRRGDRVAGYIIGEIKNAGGPKTGPDDRIIPGTETTLELIHAATGEKHILTHNRVHRVPRERSDKGPSRL